MYSFRKLSVFPLLLSIAAFLATSSSAIAGEDNVEKKAKANDTQLSPTQLNLGKRSFIRCQACHTLSEGEAHLTGPNLYNLFSAKAGEREGFAYSEALAKSGVKWDDESLRAWLKSPFTFIPGNKMAFAGIANDRELDALMAYLKDKTK